MGFVNRILTGRSLRNRIADNRDRLYGVALAWCGDAMVADDLVQETLFIALQRVSQLRDKTKLNAWMYSILSNCWKQHLRRMRPTLDIDETSLLTDTDTETCCSEQEVIEHVRQAILRLPVGQRQSVTLVDLGGFTYAEVADILEVPIGTVMSRLHAARRNLQSALANVHSSNAGSARTIRRIK